MRPDLAAAAHAIHSMADVTTGDTATGWRHAAQVVRLWKDSSTRALKQLHHHARFWKDTAPQKAAAYRRAAALFTRLTGEHLAPVTVPASVDRAGHQQAFAFS
ncbi:MAG: hypothetical protein EOP83_14790 [Verrucomicrobiaceae bacterium]|nr:MAG: hypothetical protein EOP83_14790 [Verrucomicrobiaceae bacterium]